MPGCRDLRGDKGRGDNKTNQNNQPNEPNHTNQPKPNLKLRRRRKHGLELPLHPLQILGWFALLGISVGTFTIIIPLLDPLLRLPISLGLSFLLLVHILFQLVALLIDPAAKLNTGEANELCQLCNVDTSVIRTKHCWYCNKCIIGFDHHCKWLNNCIGSKNYPVFIGCVLSAIACSVFVTGIVVAELVVYIKMDNTTTFMPELPGTGSLVVISVVGILSTIAAVLLIHLCLFHGYIGCLGVTTYEYVTTRRRKKRQQQERKKSFHFCEAVDTTEGEAFDTNSIYICSSHRTPRNDHVERDRKKFHLYFSYETRTGPKNEVQIDEDTSSQVDDSSATSSTIQLKPSTPSPVSCCFSIMSPQPNVQKKKVRTNEGQKQEIGRRSCATIKRIHTFLSTKLRKSARQRALAEASAMRKNKVTPVSGAVEQNLQALDEQVTAIYKLPTTEPLQTPTSAVVLKRNQMRLRKSVLRKRPRFNLDNHLTQTAQLSPIPESENSKPASPLATRFNFSPQQTPTLKN